MANPRKFSEKIALHNQKQAEETAAFERIMQEVSVTRVVGNQPLPSNNHLQPHPQGLLRPYLGGSLPNVNQIAANPHMTFHPQSVYDDKPLMRHPGRLDSRMRPYGFNHRRAIPLELNRNKMMPLDHHPSQYAGSYLSPPSESNWRRTNSDSALHKSAMNQPAQDPFNPESSLHSQARHESLDNSRNNAQLLYKNMMEAKHSNMQMGNRPKSCDAPNMRQMATGDSPAMRHAANAPGPYHSNGTPSNLSPPIGLGLSHVTQIGNNTGSLPDLTNLHIPSPLIHPIDDDMSSPPQQSGNPQASPHYNQPRNTSTAISPHLSGLARRPASPGRSRRNAHNGPSPLIISSPEDSRRMKYPNQGAAKAEVKSPPHAAPYSHPQGGMGWPPATEQAGSPTYGQIVSPPGNKQSELTTANNPALSEAYYRSDVQPLQYQFEQFHVVSDANNAQHHSTAPPVYSALATLNEAVDGMHDQGNALLPFEAQMKHDRYPNSSSGGKIPDIVFTGADDPQLAKPGPFSASDFGNLDFDYFPGSDLKTNQYLEELQMLDEPNTITDPPLDDQLHLNSI